MIAKPRKIAALIAAGLALSALSACGDDDKSGAAAGSDLEIVMIGGPLSDPFFSAISAGAKQAGKDLGVTVDYTAPKDLSNVGPDMARLGDAALAAKPDAVVAGEFLPDAQDPGLQKLIDGGTPVVFVNAGPNWESMGGVTYIGEDPTLFGTKAGDEFVQAGLKNVICVDHVPGNPTLEARCKGLAEEMQASGGKSTIVNIPTDQGSNPTAVAGAISGALRADDTIDGVLTLGSGIAESAVKAIADAGSDAVLGTGDLSKNVLNFVKDGKIAFAIDQQPYLQGYYGVLAAVQKVQLGVQPIGQVRTAPLIINKDNVDETIKFNDANDGVRGAA